MVMARARGRPVSKPAVASNDTTECGRYPGTDAYAPSGPVYEQSVQPFRILRRSNGEIERI